MGTYRRIRFRHSLASYVEHNGVEIGKLPVTEDGITGWQGCNLCEVNGGACSDVETFYEACVAASVLGTLQAGYTNFKFLGEESKRIFEREALIGVSITGWMNNPHILFDEAVMKKGAEIVKRVNRDVAKLIGINPAARTTCAKPSGNASVLLSTASGIHGEHAPRYIRHVQMNKGSEVAQKIAEVNPGMVEDSVWSATKSDYVIAFPIVSKEGSIYKKDLLGIKQLEYVKKAQTVWVEEGTNVEFCSHPALRHNISNTIVVDDWDKVTDYIYDNRHAFCGISFLSMSGDKDYPQAPFTEVKTFEQIGSEYGNASLYASGLISHALEAFNDDLWAACNAVVYSTIAMDDDSHKTLLKRDFVRRFKKFADNWFDGDIIKTSYCLKDVYLIHKWDKIQSSINPIDWANDVEKKSYTDIATLGAVACSGGVCEITF